MISVSEAIRKVLDLKVKFKIKENPILECLGMVLAQDVVSYCDIPICNNSAMDGYAVRVVDIKGADKNYPVKLKLAKKDIPAGKVPSIKLEPGYCTPIMTGAIIPEGCNCVIMKEDTEKINDNVLIFKEGKEGENIRYKGEDIKKGDVVLKKGKQIYPADIGVMASLGVYKVKVCSPPIVGIIPTGSELIDIDSELEIGKVRDSNSYSLSGQVKEAGAVYKRYGIVKDEENALKKKVTAALSECDILLLSGGVSVGDYDFVKDTLVKMGAKLVFWRVNQKPGKPLAVLSYKNKPVFGLPGNPVSVMVCFEMYVRPLIRKIMGHEDLFRSKVKAKALHDFEHKRGRTDFARVILEKRGGQYFIQSTGMQGSGILTSMVRADGIAVLPEEKGDIRKDDEVEVYLLKDK